MPSQFDFPRVSDLWVGLASEIYSLMSDCMVGVVD